MFIRFFILYNCVLSFLAFSYQKTQKLHQNIINYRNYLSESHVFNKDMALICNDLIFKSFGFSNFAFKNNLKSIPANSVNQVDYIFPKIEPSPFSISDLNLQELTFGIVTISTSNIRKSPHHNSELVTQELMGTPVKVLKAQDDWYFVQTPNGYTGWIDAPGISLRTLPDMENLSNQIFGIYMNHYGQIYSSVAKDGIVSDVVLGNIIEVTENLVGFYAVTLPDGRRGFIEKEGLVNLKSIFYQSKIDTVEMVKLAKSLMGVSYLWGGKSSKAVDCSGFISILYFFSGIILQRDASQQIKYGEQILVENDLSNLKSGDLLFFGREAIYNSPEKVIHVGMYIGKGEFIHSSGYVRVSKIDINSAINNNGNDHVFLRAIRIINSASKSGIQKIEDNELFHYFCEN